MRINEIANMPTVLDTKDFLTETSLGLLKHERLHESLLRSYHVIAKVRELLGKNTPSDVILEMLDLMQSNLFQPYAWHEEQYRRQGEQVITEKNPIPRSASNPT